jgi:hypothetical protein
MNRDDIIQLAREAGFYIDQDWIEHGLSGFERFAALVMAQEREACAITVEQAGIEGYGTLAAAAAIRARGLAQLNAAAEANGEEL